MIQINICNYVILLSVISDFFFHRDVAVHSNRIKINSLISILVTGAGGTLPDGGVRHYLAGLVIGAVETVAVPLEGNVSHRQPVSGLGFFLQTATTALVQVPHTGAPGVIVHAKSIISACGSSVRLSPNPDIGHQFSPFAHQSCQGFLVGIYSGEIRLGDFIVEL